MTSDATKAQNAAADPQVSTWLSANAGSGKTRVLTDRVARLLLAGCEPQNILCLTYTKAAASEMQNRLFKRLGEWAMMKDGELRTTLASLGETPPDSLARARTLFARAIEAPGGLKIQTIHSFCSAILRQFPLEAGVSPQFRELDEPQQKALIETVLDKIADAPALADIAFIHSDDTLTELAASVAKDRELFNPPQSREQIFASLGVPAGQTAELIVGRTLSAKDILFLKGLTDLLRSSGKSTDEKLAAKFDSLPLEPSIEALETLETCLLAGGAAKEPFSPKTGKIPTKDLREGAFQPNITRFNDIIERVADARDARLALDAAEKTTTLHAFAHVFLPAYRRAKENSGVLDFDDLIQHTRTLLSTRSLEWVLYRLDGGIEHILVDEAQDTSPPQWDVIDTLAREIIAGEGAHGNRTIFIVGDKKQSIYSFQGADARAFDRMKDLFTERLAAGSSLQSRELHFSFRSSAAILDSVDHVFEGDAGRGLGQDISHRAFHEALPGRVDLWPLIPAPEKDEKPAWYDPVDRIAPSDPRIQLADTIANTIDQLIKTETIPGENGLPRQVRAGDFMILVQGRGALFDQIIRACKSRNLPIAGADRLKIAGELAVKDLLALLSFLALQEDSLSLAAALRSPLFGWTEKDLYNLAQGRKQPYLWAELRDRKDEFPETFAILASLLRQVDFLRPYELLELILTRFDGRRNLLARLGSEAEDGIDELLSQALSYESDHVPTLTGFLTQAQSDDIEIKRQSDSSGDLIRVMTVHGAKGLESPIVILPDTTRPDRTPTDPILKTDLGLPVWRVSNETCPGILEPARESARLAREDERRRLLYVAMTRAETWLIVCGAQNKQNPKSHWHADVRAGLERLGADPLETPTGRGLRVSHGIWPTTSTEPGTKEVTKKAVLPDFLQQAAPEPLPRPTILSPSDLGGAKVAGGGAQDEEAALRYGSQIHLLLERLPATDHSLEATRRILAAGAVPADEPTARALHTEALAAIEAHPDLFTSTALAEIDIAAHLRTLDGAISGTIDRLIVAPDRITAVDFKSNAIVPDTPENVPEGLLRQMGAYLEALESIYPDRTIHLAILWTRTAQLMPLPHGIVRDALSRTTTS